MEAEISFIFIITSFRGSRKKTQRDTKGMINIYTFIHYMLGINPKCNFLYAKDELGASCNSSADKDSTSNAEDTGYVEWRKRQPTPCSCLKNPTVRRAWWAIVQKVAQSPQTRLKD